MYIRRKVFSLLEVEGEERLFSTTDINLEDSEERLFSLNEEKLFARRDYEGLNKLGREELSKERSKLAKRLLQDRKDYNNFANERIDKYKGWAKDYIKEGDPVEQVTEDLNKNIKKVNRDKYNNYNESIKKSRKKAAEAREFLLGDKKYRANKLVEWAKNNKKGLAIGAGIAALGGGALAAYKVKKKKDKK